MLADTPQKEASTKEASTSDSPKDEWPYRIFEGGKDHGIYWGRDAGDVRNEFAQDKGYDDYDAYANERGDHVWVRQWHFKFGGAI